MICINYEGRELFLDVEDMDTDQAHAMERFGIPNLKALEDGLKVADVNCLTVYYWLALTQNGEPGARLERVRFKPIKFLKAIAEAGRVAAEAAKEDDPKDDQTA